MSIEPVISEPQQRGSDMSTHGLPEQGGFIAISSRSQQAFVVATGLRRQVWHCNFVGGVWGSYS